MFENMREAQAREVILESVREYCKNHKMDKKPYE
jgi:hypothetical protein